MYNFISLFAALGGKTPLTTCQRQEGVRRMRTLQLVPQKPALYHFVQNGSLGGDWPYWMKWGWCRAEDILSALNYSYGLGWSMSDLLDRFAFFHYQVEETQNGKKHRLMVVANGPHGPLTFQPYNFKLRKRFGNGEEFFVPAGWAKEVFWTFINGYSRFEVLPQGAGEKPAVVACDESGKGWYYV